jgi:hypothetical protein
MIGASVALAKLPACGTSGDGTFSADQLAMLNGFADVIIPRDDQPGGADLGAVTYIVRLIRAFEVTPPAIYAGGPYSGRQPFPDGTRADPDFATFIELDRVTEAAWRPAVAEIKDQLVTGLDAALARTTADVHAMTPAQFQAAFDGSDADFKDLVIDLVCQAAFAAPEYGGNPGGAGWQLVHFEGDSLPRGYSHFDGTGYVERPEAPLSTPNPGADPEPLSDDVKQLLATVVSVLGGRVKA